MAEQTRGPNETLPQGAVEAQDENRLIAERRAKLAAIRAQGVAFPNDFRRDAYAGELQAKYAAATAEQLETQAIPVTVAGRMLAKRVMGKASFATISDPTGRIQLFLQASALPDVYDAFKGWDVGDTVGAAGMLFRTRTGELSVKVTALRLLVKSLRPLPDKWHGLADVDTRYRQRYVDLIVNEDSRKVFEARTRIVRALRAVLDARGLHGSGNADDAAHSGWRHRAAVHHAPQRARHGHVPAHRAGAVPEAPRRRRFREGLRDQPQFPQRGAVHAAQPRVHDAGAVLGLRGLPRPDGPDRATGQGAGGGGAAGAPAS